MRSMMACSRSRSSQACRSGRFEELEDERVLDHVAWDRDLVPLLREGEHLLLVAALRQALEEEGGDLPLQLASRPRLAQGLDLVERASIGALDLEEKGVVGPAERRREHRCAYGPRFGQHRWPFLAGPPDGGFGQRRWPFFGSAQPGGHRRPTRVGQVELSDAPKAADAVARAELRGQPFRQALDDLLAVARALLPLLLDLDDLPADEPVGLDHGRVHRARDVAARRLDDLRDPLE